MSPLTVAICSYNRAARLPGLIAALRAQECPIPFEILVVNNNSTDNTLDVLKNLASQPGTPLRFVTETEQGIVPARNRAIRECLDSDYMVCMDDDELPLPGLLNVALQALDKEGADCAGGQVQVNFSPYKRPHWLDDELLGFLAEVGHGDRPFWIRDTSTPVWTGNVAYRVSIFRNDPELRFDARYNRKGTAIGGGEDAILFRALLERNLRIRYCPDMVVEHFVESRRLKRAYFLRLHFFAGQRFGRYQTGDYVQTLCGVPYFMFGQAARQWLKVLRMGVTGEQGVLRQAMNGAHAVGCIMGRYQHWRDSPSK